MALIEFENKPSTNTPFNATNLNYNFSEILNLMYPIGRGFIDFTNTDYSNYLGFTWERELVGLTPVGLDTTQEEFDTIGKIGGEKTHTLTVNELAAHKHSMYTFNAGGDGTIATGGGIIQDTAAPYKTYYATFAMENTGGGQPHNNLPPYKVVAYWKRVA